ncbi:MAG TPA: hypothetical protein G4O12_03100 [Dehalococcoidia bacterium]|nr:hypothetical protein [Dehalococcoidia bacterium]
MLLNLAVIVIGYLLGSVPSAYIVARLREGVDIREIGVRNVGAGFAALLGHKFLVFLSSRGGKGVSTIMGIF